MKGNVWRRKLTFTSFTVYYFAFLSLSVYSSVHFNYNFIQHMPSLLVHWLFLKGSLKISLTVLFPVLHLSSLFSFFFLCIFTLCFFHFDSALHHFSLAGFFAPRAKRRDEWGLISRWSFKREPVRLVWACTLSRKADDKKRSLLCAYGMNLLISLRLSSSRWPL